MIAYVGQAARLSCWAKPNELLHECEPGQGEPRIVALQYFSLGERAEAGAKAGLGDYYGFAGLYADRVVAAAIKTPDEARERVARFESVGVDELILFPAIAEVEQVDLLADAVEPAGRT